MTIFTFEMRSASRWQPVTSRQSHNLQKKRILPLVIQPFESFYKPEGESKRAFTSQTSINL